MNYLKSAEDILKDNPVIRRVEILITPIPAPRLTRNMYWTKIAKRYFAYKDELYFNLNQQGVYELPGILDVDFYMPMAKSWTVAKRNKFNGHPHRSRPDSDNLLKGVMDALGTPDAHVWFPLSKKVWGETGMIVLNIRG